MKQILILEYVGGLALGVSLYAGLHLPWWWYAALFLVPDVAMLGYLFGPRVGAAVYNVFHHFGVAVALLLIGQAMGNRVLEVTGIILISHLFFDRILGYGLKYADSFHHTHLGPLKPAAATQG